jgi:UDP-4-amino-4-deoxy-L-arabinose formyltransferase/UDP-glucuronic acid dehydrogenase (UDP-4-keto-hexauronic acid decarboxylating)
VRAVVLAYHNMGIAGLEALLRHGFDVPLVISHEDDPGENRWFGSVVSFCRDRGIPVETPADVNAAPWPERIRALSPDYLFSFYFRSMVKEELLSVPRVAALNLHGSLLPKYRGRAPVNWVLVKGETETGVTLHVMEVKPDAGDIVAQEAVPIDFDDTAVTLFGKMERAAARLLHGVLPALAKGELPRRPNEIAKGSYFGGRKPADGRIDWSRPALECYNLVRAVTRPYPGAFSTLDGDPFLVWRALPVAAKGAAPLAPGETDVRDASGLSPLGPAELPEGRRVVVGTGEGMLLLVEAEWRRATARGEGIARLLGEAKERRLS